MMDVGDEAPPELPPGESGLEPRVDAGLTSPPELPPQERSASPQERHVRPPWRDVAWRALPWIGVVALVAAVVSRALAFSSSALHLLPAFHAEPPVWSVPLRPFAALGTAAEALPVARAVAATMIAAFGAALAIDRRGSRLWPAALPILLWIWPAARASLLVVGAEAWLAASSLAILWAAQSLHRTPRWAALVGGSGLALMALAHPLGLCAAPLFAILLAMRPGEAATRWPRQGVAARPTWLAWIAALVVAVALLRWALPDAQALEWWRGCIDALRAPQAAVASPRDALPLLAPLLALVARVPPALLVITLLTTGASLRRRGVAADVSWAIVAWIVVIVVAGRPTPRALDPLIVCAPLLLLQAACGLRDFWAAVPTEAVRTKALVAAALVASIVADGSALVSGEPRTALGAVLPLVDDAEFDLPVVLDGSAIALLETMPGDVDLLPGRREGNALGSALLRVGLLQETVRMCPASSCGRVLLRRPWSGRVSKAWASLTNEEARAGAWSLRSRTAAPPSADDVER